MFLKRIEKKLSTGEKKIYYRLCESYRVGDSVRNRSIIQLGTLDELRDEEQRNKLVRRIETLIEQCRKGVIELFPETDEHVEHLAHEFFEAIREKDKIDLGQGKLIESVFTKTIKHKDIREVGVEWLCVQAARQLGIADFLRSRQWDESEIQLALTHLVSRVSYPASELRTSQWIRENSAVCELTGYPQKKITKDKLYQISHKLFSVKDDLEKFLSIRTNELFDLDDTIIIYDLTNTYFEGQYRDSTMAQYGRSKEKRSDCKLLVLAKVVNAEGFIKYSQIFEGNKTDSKSLVHIIEELSARSSYLDRKPIVVMDAGIATEANIQLLRQYGFDYMCVSRSSFKKYKAQTDSDEIKILDEKNQTITLRKARVEGDSDNYLQVHSCAKQLKEESINKKLEDRFLLDLNQVQTSLAKKSGVKRSEKVWERIGRARQKYPRVSKLYEIQAQTDEAGIVTAITWVKKEMPKQEGHYLLRTNLNGEDEKTQWTIYNTIREIESTFRTLKTDLDLRPIYHKTDAAAMAHLHLGILAYTIVNTIRYQLKQKQINNEWSDIRRIMSTQKLVTTTMINTELQTVIIRQCSEPNEKVQQIFKALNFRSKPFGQQKFVVPPEPPAETQLLQNQRIRLG